jgi:LysM repeat protein
VRAIATVGFIISIGAVVLSGCGGDDSASAPPTTAAAAETTTTIATTTTSPEVTYVIQKGDSLSKIAKQFNLTVDQIITINNITDADHIEAGQVLVIVPAGAPVAPTTTAAPPPAT